MYEDIYKIWSESKALTDKEKKELLSIADDEEQKEYRFSKYLDFGTAGMRGIIGMGTNMMNVYTVRRATQGLADYLVRRGGGAAERGVVISFDTRKFSYEFAFAAAVVLVSNGVRARLFERVHPVPMLSFAVRELNAAAGIMITASHNPKEYNGYKVYGEDGAQMSPEDTAQVVKCINAVGDCFSEKIKFDESAFGKVETVKKKIDRKYYKTIKKLCLSRKETKKFGKRVKLVYTPVHGSGYIPVTTILKKIGITPVSVPEQTSPDPEFSTVEVPNPEIKETLSLAIKMADFKNANVVFGTDPDCDRLGVAVKDDRGEFVALTGNQTGILLLDYILLRLKETGKLSPKGFAVTSFVSTGMAKLIAEDYGVELMEVPVGFKYIGEKIKRLDDTGKRTFIFGFEESCGYLRGTHCRDKDGVVASMLFAEMVCYYESKGKTVFARLNELYDEYGKTFDASRSVNYRGVNAMRDMNAVVDKLKAIFPEELCGRKVSAVRDYSAGTRRFSDGREEKLDSAKVNAVYFELEGGGFICVRPSGTEPKLKIYYSIKCSAEEGEKITERFGEFLKRYES